VPCGIARIHGGVSHCESGFGGGISDLFVVSDDRAYAVERDRVLVYDGSNWTQLGAALAATDGSAINAWRVWAGAQTVAVTATSGEVFLSEAGAAWSEERGLAQDNYRTVWGFGSDSIWSGGRSGALVRYDGSAWLPRGQLTDDCGSGIRGMWGAGRALYTYTEHALARWSGTDLDIVTQLPCTTTIRGVWGTSPSEVYMVTSDALKESSACGAAELFSVAEAIIEL
jgi:hypothetical protein